MSKVIGDTVAEFWSFVVSAFGAAWPWVFALLAFIPLVFLFRGRFAVRWLFPLALVAGAAWANHRWQWFAF
jgi:hypothetical protein